MVPEYQLKKLSCLHLLNPLKTGLSDEKHSTLTGARGTLHPITMSTKAPNGQPDPGRGHSQRRSFLFKAFLMVFGKDDIAVALEGISSCVVHSSHQA